MDDNVHMEPYSVTFSSSGTVADACLVSSGSVNGDDKLWRPSHILDFSDLSIG